MSTTATLDQDALANLTPEEREAFNEPEYSPEELASMKRLAGDAAEDDGDPDEVLDANGNPVAVPVQIESKPAAAPVVDTPVAPVVEAPKPNEPQAEEKAPAQSVYKASLPEDYEQKQKDITDRAADLRAKFKGGDLEFDDYEAQLATLNQDREQLNQARVKAEISQEMTQQQAAAQWSSAIDSLFKTATKDGIDYRADPDRNSELDQFVKILANNAAHASKPMEWFLAEGHKRVMALNGKTPNAPAKAEEKPVPAAQNRTPPAAPKNIAQIPGGDGPGDVGGEFAHLDALDGNDLESAIAKMTPAQREKFSRGQ